MDSSSAPNLRAASLIHQFRPSDKRQQPLHPLETALIVVASLQLIFLPWAIGGMRPWAQFTSLGLAAVALLIALLPRYYDESLTGRAGFRLYPAPRLLRFPFFWLGIVLFAIIAVQAANPAWTYLEKNGLWWIEPVDHIAWLPHGVADTPFRMMNSWRTVMIYAAPWLLLCALWIGLTRRRSVQALLLVVTLNGFVFALVAILQRLTGTKLMLWYWTPPASAFVGTFVYKNHAGAFLLLVLFLCLGFAWWHADSARRQLKKSHPGAVFAFLSALVTFALLLSYARGATALGLFGLAVILVGYGIHVAFARRGGSPPLLNAAMVLLAAGFLSVCVYFINTDEVWKRFGRLFANQGEASIGSRLIAAQATWDMAKDSAPLGHGAGAFRFVFPWYQQHYPEIFNKGGRKFWDHAHNDYLEFLAEFGLLGLTWLLAGLAFCLAALRRSRFFAQSSRRAFLLGPALVALSATGDFPFHNPAVLTSTVAVVALVIRWAQLDQLRRS